MPIDPFSFKGAGVLPFSEIDRLSKMLSAVDPVSKLHSALTQMVPSAGADLSLFRGVLSNHTHFAALQSEQLRVAIQSGERFKAMSVAAGGGAFSALDDLIGSRFHAPGLPDMFSNVLGHQKLFYESIRAIRGTAYHDAALQSATLASSHKLFGALDDFRISKDMFADRLAVAGLAGSVHPGHWKDPVFLSAFGGAAALANVMSSASMITVDVQGAMRSLASAGIPSNLGLQAYRGVLGAAGLILPRWPTIRQLTPKERAERQAKRLRKHKQPPQIGKAKSLVHQYERYLREVIDELMTDQYGDDWANERLAICASDPDSRSNARKLLSVWKREGGNVLDHADFVHYRMIMTQHDHFSDVFALGFGEDPLVLSDLIDKVRELRGASHHSQNTFTTQDLQDLHVTWKAIAIGLEALTLGVEMVFGEG